MFTSPEQLKEFILWAKAHQILQLKVADVEVIFAPHSFVHASTPDLAIPTATSGKEEKDTGKVLVDDMQADVDDEEALLFHSSRG